MYIERLEKTQTYVNVFTQKGAIICLSQIATDIGKATNEIKLQT